MLCKVGFSCVVFGSVKSVNFRYVALGLVVFSSVEAVMFRFVRLRYVSLSSVLHKKKSHISGSSWDGENN